MGCFFTVSKNKNTIGWPTEMHGLRISINDIFDISDEINNFFIESAYR